MRDSANDTTAVGLQTFLTRVEDWEHDFNGHWNTQFYGRAFAEATDVVAALGGYPVGGEGPASWHMRFHRELFSATVVELFSSVVAEGEFAGGLLHILNGNGRLSATALGLPGPSGGVLPESSPDLLSRALPRGLVGDDADWRAVARDPQRSVPLGILRADHLDERGRLPLGQMWRFCGHGSHDHHVRLGLSPGYAEETNVSRMLVEMRTTLLTGCRPGGLLRMDSRLVSVQRKSFVTAHLLRTEDGQPMARMELCLLAVDMVTRRPTNVPEFLRALV